MFCREDGTPLDRWHVRKEFQRITKAARLGGEWTARELRHSFVSILSAPDVRLEDISDLVGHSSTPSPETVYRHEIRPAPTKDGHKPQPEGEGCQAGLSLAPGNRLAPELTPEPAS